MHKSHTDNNNKKFMTISTRIERAQSLLETNKITPLTELNQKDDPGLLLKHNDHDCKSNHKCTDSTCVFQKKLIRNFNSLLYDINADVEYVKSGTSGHTFKGTTINTRSDSVSFVMKVVAYPKYEKYGDIYDIRRPENAELAIIKLLGWFVTSGQTPHIILPIGTFNVDLNKFIKLTENKIRDGKNKDISKFKNFVKGCEKREYHKIASVLVAEWANCGDLSEYLRINYHNMGLSHWKVLFFQVISTLAVIHEIYPNFRHNDLKPNNILICKDDNIKGILTYRIKGQYYILPNVGFTIRLWDFDFACIPGIADNAKVYAEWSDSINIKPEKNRYYDMHYFINTLTNKSFFPEIFESKTIPDEVREFVRRIVPEKYVKGDTVANKGRILLNDEYVLPINVISKDPFFAEFRYTDEQKQKLDKYVNKSKKKSK